MKVPVYMCVDVGGGEEVPLLFPSCLITLICHVLAVFVNFLFYVRCDVYFVFVCSFLVFPVLFLV